jgi:hypothetical protein
MVIAIVLMIILPCTFSCSSQLAGSSPVSESQGPGERRPVRRERCSGERRGGWAAGRYWESKPARGLLTFPTAQ